MLMEWDLVAVSLIGGICLGVFYFGSLWLTVRRLITSRQPFQVALLSFCVRLAVLIVGCYILMDDSWERLLFTMAGFLMVRIAALRLARPTRKRVLAV